MKLFAKTLRRVTLVLLMLLWDFLFFSAACFASYWLRFHTPWPIFSPATPQNIASYWLAYFVATYMVLSQMAAWNLYAIDRFRGWREELQRIVRAVTFATVLLLSLSFFYRQIQFSRQMVMMAWLLTIPAMTLARVALRAAIAMARRRGRLSRGVLLMGQGSMLPLVLDKLNLNRGLGLRVVGLMAAVRPPGAPPELPYWEESEHLPEVLDQTRAQIVLIAEESVSQERILEIIEICEKRGIELLLVPQVFDLLIGHSDLRDLEGMPMMELREEPVEWGTLVIKRFVDICGSLTLLVLTLPAQVVLGLMIRWETRGPAIFKQERAGFRGQTFRMWKFRSMVADAEKQLGNLIDFSKLSEPVFKLQNDPRITRLGAWLRRTSLDELPQLWNVLRGDMSLVGPRPEEVGLVGRYNRWQRRRLKVKPGITGLQQIKCRGSESLAERVKFDIYYIRRLSVLFDVEIMVRTIWVVLSQKGAH